jgi:hypothetical protein
MPVPDVDGQVHHGNGQARADAEADYHRLMGESLDGRDTSNAG